MPRGDGTGPAGMGSMTGRGAGYCAGYSVPGYMNSYGGRYAGGGRAFGGGFGRGRGYRNQYYATGLPGGARYNAGMPAWGGVGGYPYQGDPYYGQDITPEQETESLKNQADFLKQQLDDIQTRMDELSKKQKAK